MILKEYTQDIYPFSIWIGISSDFDKVTNKFISLEYGEKFELDDTNTLASTLSVFKSGKAGVLILFKERKLMNTRNISHESSHAAKIIFKLIGAEVQHHEPFEYLVGYIANCCEKTKNYKKRRVKTTKKGGNNE